MMTTDYKEMLNAMIMSSQSIGDIIPLLQLISINKIQLFLQHEISNFESNAIKSLYYKTASIMDILPDDIVQFSESFIQSPTHSIINKQWNKYHKNNNKIRLALRNRAIQNVQFNSNILFDIKHNKTRLVENNRIFANSPIPSICDGSFQSIDDALKVSNTSRGDRIILGDGIHWLTIFNDGYVDLDHDIQVIGVGNNVRLKCKRLDDVEEVFSIQENAIVHFENIIFDFSDHNSYEGLIKLLPGANLFMKHCKIMFGNNAVTVMKNSNLYTEHCEFIGGTTGIGLSPISNEVTVIRCLFKNCGNEQEYTTTEQSGCICVANEYRDFENGNKKFVTLKCIANTFENNMCYPIIEKHYQSHQNTIQTFVLDSSMFHIEKNNLRGNNATKVALHKKKDGVDANKIYFDDSKKHA